MREEVFLRALEGGTRSFESSRYGVWGIVRYAAL